MRNAMPFRDNFHSVLGRASITPTDWMAEVTLSLRQVPALICRTRFSAKMWVVPNGDMAAAFKPVMARQFDREFDCQRG